MRDFCQEGTLRDAPCGVRRSSAWDDVGDDVNNLVPVGYPLAAARSTP
jgi:hypothetical protein